MYIHVFDASTLSPVTNVRNLIAGSCSLRHNESAQASISVRGESPEIVPLYSHGERFSMDALLSAPARLGAHLRDNHGRLWMQGRLTIQLGDDGECVIVINDLLDELRMVCLPPQLSLNGYVRNLITLILSFVPPSDRLSEMAYPAATIFRNERWRVSDLSEAIEAWTTLDAGRLSCLEALIAVCEATGINFRLEDDGSRRIRIYSEPTGDPIANLVQGGLHARQPARFTMTILDAPEMVVENETVIAGVFPEGGSYTTEDNISRVLRLTGAEVVPAGYRQENVNGFWGIFREDMVGTPANSAMPTGQIRCEAFGSITPMVNTFESVSAVVESVAGVLIKSASLDGRKTNHWQSGKATFGETEVDVTYSSGDSITLSAPLPVARNDIISVEVFRPWDIEVLKDNQQSLAGAAVAFLENSQRILISWRVRVANGDVSLRLGQFVRLIYSGGIQMRGWQGTIARPFFSPTVNISETFVISALEITQDENGMESVILTLTDRLWRFPSSSGLREIMALIQRRMPGVRMGREGAVAS